MGFGESEAGWGVAELGRGGNMERATARAASVSAGEGRCDGGVGGLSAWGCCGRDGGWVVVVRSGAVGGAGGGGSSGRASPVPKGVGGRVLPEIGPAGVESWLWVLAGRDGRGWR
jgi:hypothetical protein